MARKAKAPRSHAVCEGLGLLDFVPAVSPEMMPPTHVEPFVRALEGADRGRKRVVVAVPCQHGKPLVYYTQVTMADGSRKAISEVRVGDRVVTGFGNIANVTGHYDQGELDVLEMATLSGRMVTAERTHQFFVSDSDGPPEWLRIGDVDPAVHWAEVGGLDSLGFWRSSDRVVSVRSAGKERCYCITVDRDSCFLGNEFVTHNSQTLFHAVAWMLLRNPRMTILYASYSKAFAWRNSRTMRRLAETAGVDLSDDHNTVAEWQTSEHGGLVATSVDGEATGYKVDVVLIDDPYKNRAEAENARHREEVEAWLTGVILPRLTPTGSCFIVASRWHPEDLSGAMIAKGWDNITLPAISEEGEALCPWGPDPENQRDLAFLLKLKEEIGEYDFQSLYQGNPKPPGGAVFKGVSYADKPDALRGAFGVDLSYSGGASTDHSVVVTLVANGKGCAHVLDVTRWRAGFGEASERLAEIQGRFPGMPFVSYAYGPEKGALQSLAVGERKVLVHALKVASVSKLIRAQRTAEAWNAGRITVQRDAPWARAFVRELEQFTGSGNDSADDQVDALVAAFDFVCGASAIPERVTFGRRRV